jgi:phosphoribosylanthranilate isomerase
MIHGEKIKIKVCGMRDAENIRQVADLGPDYMGFIFYPPSPRFVGADFRLIKESPAHIVRVGVFVNATNDEIKKQARAIGFDHVQLHGSESVQQAASLVDAGFKVIKVFSVDDTFDFAATKKYVSVVDYFLFDTKGKFHGGNARTFNWNVLQRYDQDVPFFLSGGISTENMNDITSLAGMNLFALDVNSGVEESPGVKSLTKLKAIFDGVERIRLNDLKN